MTRTPAKRLSEVAQKVGVSEATVSRVLNGKAGVSDNTREAVLTALDVLGYERPTRLRGQRARLIGLVLPELQNPIFPALAEVIGGALAQRGFTPVLCTRTAGGLSEADYVDMLLEQHASGVVFAGGHFAELAAPHEHYELLHERGIPVVLVNAAIDGLEFPCVATDDHSAAQQAFGHLLALGHERIGMVLGPDDHMPSRRKMAAFHADAARVGMSVAPVEHALFSLEGGQAATTRILRQGVTGLICGSDVLALGAIRAVRRAGLSVPGAVSVVGFDDSGWLNCTDPPLTTVRQPIESMGKAAVALLVNQMETTMPQAEELLFEPELVVRGSTGPAPASPQQLLLIRQRKLSFSGGGADRGGVTNMTHDNAAPGGDPRSPRSGSHDHAARHGAAHDHGSHEHGSTEAAAPHGEQAWDERYQGKPEIWSGNPNAALVAEVTALTPGTALDAGAGEGGDATWLASQGWTVTAADISSVALKRAAASAVRLGVEVTWLHADLAKAPAPGTYDLVTAHFLHVPKAEQQQLFRHLAAAVAPGGTLLVVGHDFSDMATLPRPHLTEFGWTTDEVAAALDDGWTIEVAEARPRQFTMPDGDEVTIRDAILRARRDGIK